MTTSPISAILVSIGGTPAPVLHVLHQYKPGHVWYFCSEGSRENAEEVQRQLAWRPQARFIEVERFEELGPCYRELRQKVPEILRETMVAPAEVMVDYTCGTKTMSAALVLAATELFEQFSYVGGRQREKGGLGVTMDGKERVLYQGNPWSELAIREVERARDLWHGCQFEAASSVLGKAASQVPGRLRFETMSGLCDAMAARHRLDFKEAVTHLGKAKQVLPAYFDGRDDKGLQAWVGSSMEICTASAKDLAGPIVLRELLDNTLRTAAQGRYEDAAARLYRAMEMQGQIWLAEATQCCFANGRCKAQNITKLPEVLQNHPLCQANEGEGIKLSAEQIFTILAALNHAKASAVKNDIALDKKSRWRQATEKRNASILAHGVNAVGSRGFADMKTLAAEFLGFDLEGQANPIPSLDLSWFA